jgi:uncharacterized protein (TIGR03437 family)
MQMLRAALIITAALGCAMAQTPVLFDGGVVNGVTYATGQPVAPGSIASLFGSSLAASLAEADTVPLSTTLANVSVTVNGIPAPLFFVSPGQVNIQIPWDALPDGVNSGPATIALHAGQLSSNVGTVQIAAVAPAIFTVVSGGAGNAIAINPDGSIAAPTGSIPGLAARPAQVGDPIVILATGLGAVTPSDPNGANSMDQLRTTVATPNVFVGGQPAQLLFSGLSPSFTGVDQINVVVPSVAGGAAVPLQLQVNQVMTSNQVTIAIQ